MKFIASNIDIVTCAGCQHYDISIGTISAIVYIRIEDSVVIIEVANRTEILNYNTSTAWDRSFRTIVYTCDLDNKVVIVTIGRSIAIFEVETYVVSQLAIYNH